MSRATRRSKAERNINGPLARYYNESNRHPEIGVDEAGKGPMFGRVYAAAVCLPRTDDDFPHNLMKDSKRFHSNKKIMEAYEAIKKDALAWSVSFEEAQVIDCINIRQATFKAMHKSILDVASQLKDMQCVDDPFLVIDGNDFMPITSINQQGEFVHYNFTCVEGGDNKFTHIAAASILAKVERDAYIDSICEKFPELDSLYGLKSNKGYGTSKHMDGLRAYGLSPWHRKTYGVCKTLKENEVFADCQFN